MITNTNPAVDAVVPPMPTEPAKFLVFNSKTKQLVDIRLPGEEDGKLPKGCTIAPMVPGGVRRASDLISVEAWPAADA